MCGVGGVGGCGWGRGRFGREADNLTRIFHQTNVNGVRHDSHGDSGCGHHLVDFLLALPEGFFPFTILGLFLIVPGFLL